MIRKLFPYKLHLQIFQLDEYEVGKFLEWIGKHFWVRSIENKKPLVWTQKAKAIYYLAILLAFFVTVVLIIFLKTTGLLIGLLLATQSYTFLLLASYFLLPLENYQKTKMKINAEHKLSTMKKLKIIGITGSYGKTSVKEFLYQILKTEHAVLKTPASYNTPYGIAKVVDLELDDSYEYFICEMGAYKIGDIKEICDMVHPKYGILTGINEQHLQTFGSLENTTKGKFELIEALPADGFGVVNNDNEHVKKFLVLSSQFSVPLTPYGFSEETFSLKRIKQIADGSEFELVLDREIYKAKTKLIGRPNLQNILAAATMSFLLGIKPQTIVNAIAQINPVPHRLEIQEREQMTIIDDAYNSNIDGFREAIALLSSFKRPSVLVTPGIVDLGEKTFAIHKELGKLLDDVDHIILIGGSERTQGLTAGIKRKDSIIKLVSINEVWQEIADLQLHRPVILLENDLPDNY